MIVQDDRTEEQKKTHRLLVIMTDSFLSGWGGAEGGASYAAWACETNEELEACRKWVESRPDALRVRVTVEPYRPKARYCKHYHVYIYKGASNG